MAGQQVSRAPDTITEDEKNTFKLMKMTYCTARSVLYTVFLWGTKQKSDQSLEDYLLNTKGFSNASYRKCFDSYQRKLMSDRTKECGFDVSLLCKVVILTCNRVDTYDRVVWNTLEWLVKEIKSIRNDFSHDFQGINLDGLFTKASDLLELLEGFLTVAASLYKKTIKEVEEEVKKTEEDIKSVRDTSFEASDICLYQDILLNEKKKRILKEEGAKELQERYERLCQLNPVYFLENKGVLLDVNLVFTQVEVEYAGHMAKGLRVPCNEIVEFCRNNAASKKRITTSPEAYLVEGPAGAGKTTLLKYIKAGWSKRGEDMLGLDDFDLLLFMECRNSSVSSISQLLCHLMPKTNSKYFAEGELLKYTLDLKTLILVDGLDELNSKSGELFKDIINQDSNNFVILCSSRPEKVRHFHQQVPYTFHTAHLKIIGIADNKREEFIRKYHGEMRRKGMSKQDTESLINYIKRSESFLQSHFRLPLNLVLLTWLWADNPDLVTAVTTSSELYIQTHNLMKKKLLERLTHHEKTKMLDPDDLEEKINNVLCSVYKGALDSLNMDSIETLLPESVNQIKVTCDASKMPYKETLSAFFVIKMVEEVEKVSAPHKLLYDFYAAQYVVQYLFNGNKENRDMDELQKCALFMDKMGLTPIQQEQFLSNMISTKEKTTAARKPGSLKALIADLCKQENTAMNKYQSMFLQVAGIVYASHGSKVEEWIAKDIVDLLNDSELGIKDDNEWFDLIELAKDDPNVIRYCSNHIKKAITITEQRVKAANLLLIEARPMKISVSINSKTRTIQNLHTLLEKIADCECELNLAFWQDFSDPDPLPSNDEDLRIISQRCTVGHVVCHASGGIVDKLQGPFAFLSLAVTSDTAAREVFPRLIKQRPGLQIVGMCLHLTMKVSPEALSQVVGVHMLCLVMSAVQDCNIDEVCKMAKALLPEDSMLLDIRFPRAQVTFAGWTRLLKIMKDNGISSGHISIPDKAELKNDEQEDLKKFTHNELPVRGAFRRLSEKQMWESPFSTV